MNGTLTILKKELKGFYANPTFWVICFLVSVIFSWVYPIQLNLFAQLLTNYVMQQGVPTNQLNIHYGVFLRQLSYLNLLLIFVVPALTMKLFAEEKKLRTFDLLLTSPVTSLQIVLGKYFAALGAVLGIVFLAVLYPLATSTLATINWMPLVIAFFGIFLVGGVYAAMDLFSSSLTENSIVAYVTSVIFNVSIWFIGIGAEVVDGETARKVFEHVSLSSHLSSLVEGTVRTNGLVFFLSIIVLFCFLAERVVESSRWR
ncbi:ABC transporter permease [Bdellovibrio bacteriovorus]|uniref:ABC transporter permease n=1 Tax=Bdellovibrio bacteriovorus TaxID=959 RepID=A0A150WKH2_BDEBC|nr:ABC transporter permease subunit [Bdellovibrio bacteriovorus]KYG62620.1 ABC transporter permease [Bdellovibrio bacteriovorus]KYG64470.1 ABC transporter permease [Bdellovibrio bacteriovorus]